MRTTLPLDFKSEQEYEGDKEFEDMAIDAPCFRVIRTRNYMPSTDSESDSSE